MKLRDLLEDDWDDNDLEVCLESARKNLLRLKKDYPSNVNYDTGDIKSAKSMISQAKRIHRLNKSKSMQMVAIESYQHDLELDDESVKRIKLYE